MGSDDKQREPARRGRWLLLAGTVVGALAGLLFSLAVVSFADCAGPDCAGERAVGVIGHVLGGALLGEAVWAVACGVRRLARRVAR